MDTTSTPLPYSDTKPIGHADFYFATQATFRFIFERVGMEGLRNYWRDLGARYYRPVSLRWQEQGMAGIAQYWRAFFAAEPGAEVLVHDTADEVRLEVRTCPAIHHLREHGREIIPCFCQHCFFVSEAIGAPAGITVRIEGGNGRCVQRFLKADKTPAPQNLEDIATAS